MHPITHNIFAVRSRLRFLRQLQKKSQLALAFIDCNFPEGDQKNDTYFVWIYTSSLIRCVLAKWMGVKHENYYSVKYLHDKCLMKALRNNIQTGRSAISFLPHSEVLLMEWEAIWGGLDD